MLLSLFLFDIVSYKLNQVGLLFNHTILLISSPTYSCPSSTNPLLPNPTPSASYPYRLMSQISPQITTTTKAIHLRHLYMQIQTIYSQQIYGFYCCLSRILSVFLLAIRCLVGLKSSYCCFLHSWTISQFPAIFDECLIYFRYDGCL